MVNGSKCINKVCQCKAGHVASDDGLSCLPLVSSLYQPCTQDSQCTSILYSKCADNNTCLCMKNYHDVNSVRIINNSSSSNDVVSFEISFNFFQRCWSSVSLNGICESDENCIIAHTSCINKRCTCDDGFKEENNRGSKYCSNAKRVQISFLVLLIIFVLTKLL